MDFRLNKVDPDVRRRINEMTKEGKIHGKTQFKVNEYDAEDKNRDAFKWDNHEEKKKRIIVEASKETNKTIEVNATKADKDNVRGRFIDVRE